jgi:putative ABC transport system permease protein
VNEALAARQWPGEDAVGKRIATADKDAPWLTVIGVVKNTVRGRLSAPPDDEVYLPYLQATPYLEEQDSHFGYLTLVARTSGDAAALAPGMRRAVWSREPNAPIAEVAPMAVVVNTATAAPRFYLVLLAAFSAVALLLAAVGIYAVMSYAVARRTNEIGIRMALGAARAQVLRLVLRQGAAVGIGGAVAGLFGALALSHLMGSMLYGVGTRDPLTFGAVAALLTAVALFASYLPARRAARLEPVRALRED